MESDSGSDMELDSDWECWDASRRLKIGLGRASSSASTSALTGSSAGSSGSKTRQVDLIVRAPRLLSETVPENVSDSTKRNTQRKSTAHGRVSASKRAPKRVVNAESKTKTVLKAGKKRAKIAANLPKTRRVGVKKHEPLVQGQPQWHIVLPDESTLDLAKCNTRTTTCDSDSTLKPRIWTSSKNELTSIMPELSGPRCINGVSWVLTETPVIVLDEYSATCVAVHDGSDVVDVIMIRDFTCMACDIDQPSQSASSLLVQDLGANSPPQNPALSDSSRSGNTKTSPFRDTPFPPNQQLHQPNAGTDSQSSNAIPMMGTSQTQLPTPPVSQSRKLSLATWIFDKQIGPSIKVPKTEPWVFTSAIPSSTNSSGPIPVTPPKTDPPPPKWSYHSSSSSLRSQSLTQQHVSPTPLPSLYSCLNNNPSSLSYQPRSPPRFNAASRQSLSQPTFLPVPFMAHSCFVPLPDSSPLPNRPDEAVFNPTTSTNPNPRSENIAWSSSSSYSPAFASLDQSRLQPPSPALTPRSASSLHFSYDLSPIQIRPTQSSRYHNSRHGSVPSTTEYDPNNSVSSSFATITSQLLTPPRNGSLALSNTPPALISSSSPSETLPLSTTSFTTTYVMDIDTQMDIPPTPPYSASSVRRQVAFNTLSGCSGSSFHSQVTKDKYRRHHAYRPATPTVVPLAEQAEPEVTPSQSRISHLLPESRMDVETFVDQRIPFKIPPEIQALTDAYIQNTPVVVIASRSSIAESWRLELSEEFAYVYMGFFRVIGVQETPLAPSRTEKSFRNQVDGRVTWQFKFKWATGGEHFLPPHMQESISHPWWSPKPTSTGYPNRGQPDENNDPDLKSTPRYRNRRRENDHYQWRNLDLNDRYYSVLPLHLLRPRDHFSDKVFPRGWYCQECGKVNEQVMLRHQTCSSSYCQGKQSVEAYALELESVRDPQQTLPMILPLDVYPASVEPSAIMWQDGMRTLSYNIKKDEGIIVKHIFTCNLVRLQEEPTSLFRDFQTDVELRRQGGDSAGCCFSYLAGVAHSGSCATTVGWKDVPGCVSQARDFLVHRGRWYGEHKDENFTINNLVVLSWVISGSRKGTNVLEAKKHDVLVLCLGQDVALTVMPRSGFVDPEGAGRMNDLDSLHRFEEDDVMDSSAYLKDEQADGDLRSEGDPTTSSAMTKLPPSMLTTAKSQGNAKKPPKSGLLMTLVHGDILMLSGDDFEYSIKRMGTTILLIGCCVEEH